MKKLRLIFFTVMMFPVLLYAKEKESSGNGIIESWTFSPLPIGLGNYNPQAWLKHCPIINFCMGK